MSVLCYFLSNLEKIVEIDFGDFENSRHGSSGHDICGGLGTPNGPLQCLGATFAIKPIMFEKITFFEKFSFFYNSDSFYEFFMLFSE